MAEDALAGADFSRQIIPRLSLDNRGMRITIRFYCRILPFPPALRNIPIKLSIYWKTSGRIKRAKTNKTTQQVTTMPKVNQLVPRCLCIREKQAEIG